MIEYDYLCQAISDWREGKRPSAPPPPSGGMAAMEEMDSGLVMEDVGAGEAEHGYEQQPQYAEGEYAESAQPEQAVEAAEYQEADAGAPEEEYGQVDRTQAYVPEEYDPAGVAAQAEAAEASEVEVEEHAMEVDIEADVDEDEDEDADDDDFERDYDLEATDDFASFDVANDLAGWFVGSMRIEQAWEDKTQREALFAEYGVRDGQHFYQVQATMERYVQSEDALARYGDLDAIMQLQMNAHTDYHRQAMQNRAEGDLAAEFEPVEGITLQQWAQCQAAIAGGAEVDGVIAQLGIDREHWDRVSAEWNDRMSRDTTATIATEYGKAFSGAGQGQYGDAAQAGAAAMGPGGEVEGEPPIPFERYVEIEQAQAAGAEQGSDPAQVLEGFGMTALDWSNVSAWWSQYMSRHMMENNQELYHRYTQLQEHYAAQYGAGGADEDVDY